LSNFKYDLGVVGLGYVGLPLAVESANEAFNVIGYDVDSDRVKEINNGKSPIEDISDNELKKL
jgi:UDP-N-acetyl-D-glucosamine dehydrogenase